MKDCWFHLLNTVSILSIVDFHRWHRKTKYKVTPIELIRRRKNKIKTFEIECDYEIEITKFSGTLT